jgi:hypothetical protein
MMNSLVSGTRLVLTVAMCAAVCTSLFAQQRATQRSQVQGDTYAHSVDCFRPLTTDIEGNQVTTEILNACHDNVISIRFQLSSESLPKPVEMVGDFTVSEVVASLSDTPRRKNSDSGYWLVGETRKLSLSYPDSSVSNTDRLGDHIEVTAALFQAGTSAGDPHALDGIKNRWIAFKSDFELLTRQLNAPEVQQATGSREKLTRFRELRSRTRPLPDKRSGATSIPASEDGSLESPILRGYMNLPTLDLLTDEQADKALVVLQQIFTKQLEEYRRLAKAFNLPSLGEGEDK